MRDLDFVINRMTFLRSQEKRRLAAKLRDEQDLLRMNKYSLQELCGRAIRAEILPQRWIREAEKDLQWLKAAEVRTLSGAMLPSLLREIYDPPFLLMQRGQCELTQGLAIVGTRAASKSGAHAAYALARDAAESGYTVVSGLARGIDAAGHWASVSVGRPTVAVFASGLDRVYPVEHKQLGAKILAAGGCFMSENPPGTPPLKYLFPARNRIVSGLTPSIVIVEAPLHSGAMITARLALEQGRDVYVHRSGLKKEMTGSCKLADEGAPVIDSFDDLLVQMDYQKGTLEERMGG